MATRLLSKQEVIKQLSDERKMAIDEGVKLAKKVDSLREVSAKEESQLAKFREESLKRIKEDIADLINQRDNLSSVVDSLEKSKIELQKPLDEEWKSVYKRQEELIVFASKLQQESEELKSEENYHQIKVDELKIEEERINERNNRSLRESTKIDERTSSLEQFSRDIEERNKQGLQEIEQRNQTTLSREAAVSTREREVSLLLKKIDSEKIEIINKEILLRDREETLEREIIRMKKNG